MTFDPVTNQATAKSQRRRSTVARTTTEAETQPAAAESQPPVGDIEQSNEPPANEDPPVSTPPSDVTPPEDPPTVVPPADPPAPVPLATALLELPIHTCYGDGRYAAQYVELKLSRRRAAALNFLWASWSEEGQRYENGRSGHPDGAVIENGPDALKYVLDLIADQIEGQTGKSLVTDFNFVFR